MKSRSEDNPTSPRYVIILQGEFESRRRNGTIRSLRNFAKLLGLHPSAMSRVLSHKGVLSFSDAASIVGILNLSATQIRIFIESVAIEKIRKIEQTSANCISECLHRRAEDNKPA